MKIKRQPTYQSIDLIKKTNRRLLVAVIILISVLISTIILLDYYYKNSAQNNFDLGFQQGTENGITIGFNDGYAQGEEDGYVQGLIDGAGTGYTIRDPTYQEMMDFISSDDTNQNTYSTDYICFDFAADVINNAFVEGYRCGFVYVTFPNSDHGMMCFDTVDQGLIFIEPQDDNILTLIVGEPLFDRTYYNPGFDDTIVDYRIIW